MKKILKRVWIFCFAGIFLFMFEIKPVFAAEYSNWKYIWPLTLYMNEAHNQVSADTGSQNVIIKACGQITDSYVLSVVSENGITEVPLNADNIASGNIYVNLMRGSYEISCIPTANGNMLRLRDNRITVKDEPVEIDVMEEKAGNIYVRPELPEGFRGSLELQFKDVEGNAVYTCMIDEYNYPYNIWTPMFYWKTLQVPCGSYEVIRYKVRSGDHYLYSTIPTKTLDVYQSWSGMFFPTVSNIEISEAEAEKIYMDGEKYVKPQMEKEEQDTQSESRFTKILQKFWTIEAGIMLLICFGILIMYCIYFRRYKKEKRENTENTTIYLNGKKLVSYNKKEGLDDE